MLDWGCQALNPLNEQLYLKASRLQYAALRAVTGLIVTTPTNVLLDINGEYPLEACWFNLTLKFLPKIKARRSHPLNLIITDISIRPEIEKNNICYLIDTYLAHADLFEQVSPFQLPGYLEFPYESIHFDPKINTDLGSQVAAITNSDINDSFNNLISPFGFEVTYYTDGSRSESGNKSGYAVFSPEPGLE